MMKRHGMHFVMTEGRANLIPTRLFCALKTEGGGAHCSPLAKPCCPSQNPFKKCFSESLSKIESSDIILVSMETMVSVLTLSRAGFFGAPAGTGGGGGGTKCPP